jgi:DNA-binding transcriptional ArsR family regulator
MSGGNDGDEAILGLDGCVTRSVDPQRVAATAERAASPEEAGAMADLFRLLADPTRMRILSALAEAGELCVCDVAATVDVAESAVSHALRLLRTSGVVRNRRDGRLMYYRLDDAHVRLLLDVTRAHLDHDREERP